MHAVVGAGDRAAGGRGFCAGFVFERAPARVETREARDLGELGGVE